MCRSQAEAEGLTLRKADNKTGYFGVYLACPGQPKPYQTQVRRGGKQVHLGIFATAEEAALCFARSPEGQEAAKKAAAAPPLTSEEASVRAVLAFSKKGVRGGCGQGEAAQRSRSCCWAD